MRLFSRSQQHAASHRSASNHRHPSGTSRRYHLWHSGRTYAPLYYIIRDEIGLRHILARHEQGAGFMADGYARIRGEPGVVCTITEPGVTNVATPVASAYADSIPLLVIS